MKIKTIQNTTSIIWSGLILFFTYQMFLIIFPYTSWEWDVDFLITKQHIIHLYFYRLSFYSHIFTSLIVLLSGAFLFSNYILRKHQVVHRWAGRIYVSLLLGIAAPSGFVMGFYANGGFLAKFSFMILTPLWWWFTWKGFQTALRKDFRAHRIWMLRSYALTLSAISLRIYQMVLGAYFYMDPVVQYTLVSWVSWVGNLLVVEWRIKNYRLCLPRNLGGL
ncbi:MAG: DUF2306 domain-containing protein [Bacteroidota bacterium]